MKILAIGAHFDDIELGCGGTLLKHRDQGDQLFLLVITHSEYESPITGHKRLREEAITEGEKSAKLLGAKLFCLNKTPTILIPTEKLVLEVEKIVFQIQPDRVYTHQPEDNHADHAAVGFVSLRACRKCDEVFLYRSNWYIIENSSEDNFYSNISSYVDQKADLLRIFESEIKFVNYSWIDFVQKQNIAAGAKVSVTSAETFRVVKIFWK